MTRSLVDSPSRMARLLTSPHAWTAWLWLRTLQRTRSQPNLETGAGQVEGDGPGHDSSRAPGASRAFVTMKKVGVVQSNYIPWKGYFDMIAAVDEFILLDDVQYTRRDWRNRNQIKTPSGLQWLTVPVEVKGKYSQKIRDTEIHGTEWAASHWKSLWQN